MWPLFVGWALAGDPNLAPDRPGIGDSTETPGAGHVLVEGGLAAAFADGGTSFGTSSLTLRVGLGDVVEARLNVPDLGFPGPELGMLGLGVKVGGKLDDRWSLSVVPTLLVPLQDDARVAGQVNTNLAFDLEKVAFWGHVSATATTVDLPIVDDLSVSTILAGGGAQVPIGPGGVFVHGWREVGVQTTVGAGGWWCPSDTVQIDVEFDIAGVGQDIVAIPNVGVAVVF